MTDCMLIVHLCLSLFQSFAPGEATKSAFFSLLNVRLGFAYLSKEVLSIVHLFKSKTGTSTSSYLYMIKKS